jgi:hypothetical protein
MDGQPKHKSANHPFRVSTDPVRQEYRRERAARSTQDLDRRAAAVAELGPPPVIVPEDTGFAIVAHDTFDTAAVIDVAREVVAGTDIERAKAKANKPFMMKLSDMGATTLASPLLQFALRRDIIASAATYLGLVPILQYASVFYSSHANAEPAKSQLYHCDSDEVSQMKVFVLCEEVTPANGPLTFIPASLSQRVRDAVGYEYNTRLTDDQVYGVLGGRHDVALLGAPGTIAFIDTSRCLHYGSRFTDPTARRVVVMLQYVTPLAFILPDDHRQGARFRHLAEPGMDDISTLVLGAA